MQISPPTANPLYGRREPGQPQSPQQPPAAEAAALNELRAQKNRVEGSYERWRKRETELFTKIFALAGVYFIFLLSLEVAKPGTKAKSLSDCMVCWVSGISGLLSLSVFGVLLFWSHRLRFVRAQLREIWIKKRELEERWGGLKQDGATDTELDSWFIDEPAEPPCTVYAITALFYGLMTLGLSVNLVIRCKGTSCYRF